MPEHGIIKKMHRIGRTMTQVTKNMGYITLSLCQIGIPASSTAASFGKVNSRKLSEYKAEDLAAAPVNSFTYNIG